MIFDYESASEENNILSNESSDNEDLDQSTYNNLGINVNQNKDKLSVIKDLDLINRSGPNKKNTNDEDIKKLLRSGADKVSINTSAVENPSFVKEAADKLE